MTTALGAMILLAFQCQPERTFVEDPDAKLAFTVDTLFFDTVFTTIGTVTKSFRIKNPNNQFIRIDEISLAGGNLLGIPDQCGRGARNQVSQTLKLPRKTACLFSWRLRWIPMKRLISC